MHAAPATPPQSTDVIFWMIPNTCSNIQISSLVKVSGFCHLELVDTCTILIIELSRCHVGSYSTGSTSNFASYYTELRSMVSQAARVGESKEEAVVL